MVDEIKHTDAVEQARFAAQTMEQQMLDIWLNTRETNGHVAAVIRELNDLKPKVARHERLFYVAAAIVTALVAGGPFIFWALGHLTWK